MQTFNPPSQYLWLGVCVCMCVWGMVRVMWEREADVGGLGLDCCRGGVGWCGGKVQKE